jgi:hypothetical protein
MHGVLRVRIWCAFTSISLLAAVVLWLGAAPLDSFRDPTYSGLRDPMRGLYGDCAPLRFIELLLSRSATVGLEHRSGGVG